MLGLLSLHQPWEAPRRATSSTQVLGTALVTSHPLELRDVPGITSAGSSAGGPACWAPTWFQGPPGGPAKAGVA
jgi:hypothetical protein